MQSNSPYTHSEYAECSASVHQCAHDVFQVFAIGCRDAWQGAKLTRPELIPENFTKAEQPTQ